MYYQRNKHNFQKNYKERNSVGYNHDTDSKVVGKISEDIDFLIECFEKAFQKAVNVYFQNAYYLKERYERTIDTINLRSHV